VPRGGGRLIMDHHLPTGEPARSWMAWVERPELPRPWPERGDRRTTEDGSELELLVRQAEFDPLEQTTALQMRVRHLVDGQEVAVEQGIIHINLYFRREIELMLEVAGFRDVTVTAFPEDRPALPWQDERVVFRAIA